MLRVVLLSLTLLLVVSFFLLRSGGEKRVALIIGNSNYTHSMPLGSAQSNVKEMSRVLRKLGFDIISGTDLSRSDLQSALHKFSEHIRNADISVFYYSGSLDQRRHASYINPPDDNSSQSSPLVFQKVPILPLLKQMTISSRANLVLLDACRSQPGRRGSIDRSPGRSARRLVGKQKNCAALRPLTPLQRMMVVYASKSPVKNNEGQESISALAQSFSKNATRPSLSLENLIKTVGEEVATHTRRRQAPRIENGLKETIVLRTASDYQGRIIAAAGAGAREINGQSAEAGWTSLWASVPSYELKLMEFGELALLPGQKTRAAIARLDQFQEVEPRRVGGRSNHRTDRENDPSNGGVERRLQRLLARMGCYGGSIDGIWGPKSRGALRRFSQSVRRELPEQQPSRELVRFLSYYTGSRCDIRCADGSSIDRSGRCVPAIRDADRNSTMQMALSAQEISEGYSAAARFVPTSKVDGALSVRQSDEKPRKNLLQIQASPAKELTLASIMPTTRPQEPTLQKPTHKAKQKSSRWPKRSVKKVKSRRAPKRTRVARRQSQESGASRWRKRMLKNLIDP